MPGLAVLLLAIGAALGVLALSRSAGATPRGAPTLHRDILQRVAEFRFLAESESVGLVHVNVPIILAVIARETGGIPRRGAAGEVGLMQITQAAWQDYQAARNDPEAIPFPDALESAKINIRVGAWFLDRKVQEMGTLFDGIRAYNCGARRARLTPTCGVEYATWITESGVPAFSRFA